MLRAGVRGGLAARRSGARVMAIAINTNRRWTREQPDWVREQNVGGEHSRLDWRLGGLARERARIVGSHATSTTILTGR